MALGPSERAFLRGALPLSDSQRSRSAQQQIDQVAELRGVHAAFAWFRSHARELEDQQLEVTAIPAPPWGEAARCDWLRQRYETLGLAEVHQDELGNVFGIRSGVDLQAPFVALSAHLDTVFPAGTPIQVKREASKLYGPGMSDNGSGIVALLALAGAMRDAGIPNVAPILFIGNVGEEGEGDLRGMRHIFQQQKWRESIATLIALDGAGWTPLSPRVWAAGVTKSACAAGAAIPGATSDWPIPSLPWRASSSASLVPGASGSQDDLQHRHDSGRNIGQFDPAVGHHARGHALSVRSRNWIGWSASCGKPSPTSSPRCPAATGRKS